MSGQPAAKKAKTVVKTLTLKTKLETEEGDESGLDFDFNGRDVEVSTDTPVQELIYQIEEMFSELAATSQKDNVPLFMCVICLDSVAFRAEDKPLPLESTVGEVFKDGDEVIIIAEITDVDVNAEGQLEDLMGGGDSMPKIPVTIITGFLGAGKTTLLNHILTNNEHGRRIAILENEFGEMSIDDKLLTQKLSGAEQIIVSDNGCLCCTVRGDLVNMITQVLDRNDSLPADKRIEMILVETTGMADPSPIVQTFFQDETVRECCEIDGVVTMVDTRHLVEHLEGAAKSEDAEVNESIQQIAFADRIIMNKMDLMTSKGTQAAVKAVRGINKYARLLRSVKAKVDVNQLLNIGAFKLDRITTDLDPDFLITAEDECADDCKDEGHGHSHGKEDHGHGHGHGDSKDEGHGPGHGDGDEKKKKKHRHDQRVSSIGFAVDGEIEGEALDEWWRTLMEKNSKNMYRSKGVLALKGSENKMVFQAVHELMTNESLEPWAEGEKRTNKIVFIGVDLDKDSLRKSFTALVTPCGAE